MEAFGIGLHQPVFDAVMHHLHEVARAVGPAMGVTLLGPLVGVLAAGGKGNVADARRQGFEDRVQVIDDRLVAADHQAVSAIQPPDAAAGSHVDMENILFLQRLRAGDVILEEAVAAIDDDIAGRHKFAQRIDRLPGDLAGRQHDPDRARLLKPRDHVGKVFCPLGAGGGDLVHRLGLPVVNDALVSYAHQSLGYVAAHPAKADHTDLHVAIPLWMMFGSQLHDSPAQDRSCVRGTLR